MEMQISSREARKKVPSPKREVLVISHSSPAPAVQKSGHLENSKPPSIEPSPSTVFRNPRFPKVVLHKLLNLSGSIAALGAPVSTGINLRQLTSQGHSLVSIQQHTKALSSIHEVGNLVGWTCTHHVI
jgi:hypothetical protein